MQTGYPCDYGTLQVYRLGKCKYGTYGNDIARLLKDNNIKYFGDHMVTKRKANGGMVIDGKVMMRDINNLRDVTPEIQKEI